MQVLLSLPPASARYWSAHGEALPPDWIVGSEPVGDELGTGGGTVQLLHEAWKRAGGELPFDVWLERDKRLVIHAGGSGRRLPAYAPGGKVLLPIPVFRWAKGQRLDQTLLDLQLPLYSRVLARSPTSTAVMVASGDVLLRSHGPLPALPEVDVLCFGLWVPPETATHHGVFFLRRSDPAHLRFFLQKPDAARIRELATEHLFLVDTGMWMLSERAVTEISRESGVGSREAEDLTEAQRETESPNDIARSRRQTADSRLHPYELYSQFGLHLGTEPAVYHARISGLSVAVVPLPGGEFYHFGSSRDLIRSCARLQNAVLDQRELGVNTLKPHPEMFVQNVQCDFPLQPHNHTLWIENAQLPAGWQIDSEHIITGVPRNDWVLQLPRGVCLDFVPIGTSQFCIRVYGIEDDFAGRTGEPTARWFGKPVRGWFAQRGLELAEAGVDANSAVQSAPLFPVLELEEINGDFVQWLADDGQGGSQSVDSESAALFRKRWLSARRLSAAELLEQANLDRLFRQRAESRRGSLLPLARNSARSVFYHLDLARTAREYAAAGHSLPDEEPADAPLMRRVHQRMFCAAVLLHQADPTACLPSAGTAFHASAPALNPNNQRMSVDCHRQAAVHEQAAFQLLREAVIADTQLRKVQPRKNILDDQIIWARSPVRLDLAGGWTDTPPYCLIHGGKVVNVAVNLNGQPPIQVFVRLAESPHFVLRSIDLGVEERIGTYDELRRCSEVGSGFAIARASLALAGFLPEFAAESRQATLAAQLEEFGGGVEISLLAAVPKGSGLGTSSILSATLLGALSELCGLNWDAAEICRRTLALEQMLTTGGGWQDQIGGIARGLKLIETQPGLHQDLVVRWLPAHLFEDTAPKSCLLLYYTGITRVAKNILAEIVRGMFLNSSQHLATLEELGQHALETYDMLLRGRWSGLCDCIRRSWQLNQQLDAGTNPAEVQAILARVEDRLAAVKLLGAGGGGYMLMLAKDPQAAAEVRRILNEAPPNGKARFVDFDVSKTGLEITRS